MRKISWASIRKDFKKHYPRLSKMTVDYRPYNYLTIVLYFKDGMMATYDYLEKKAVILDERWKK